VVCDDDGGAPVQRVVLVEAIVKAAERLREAAALI
jgi:hypothetical protein